MLFENIERGPPDPIYDLKVACDNDASPQKVDLGVGVYRNESGQYNEMEVLKQAKAKLASWNPGHDYEVTTGNAEFLKRAASVVLGKNSKALLSGRIASVQTISGTGAVHLGALFLKECIPDLAPKVFLGTPAWGNYEPLFKLVGLEVEKYRHYDPESGGVDFESMLAAVSRAAPSSVFVLQGCCHNPTAADLTQQQWQKLAVEMKSRRLLPLFDIAYQGMGDGVDEDAYGLRHFVDFGFEALVCQSFSKNFGLYGERVGVLHAVCSTPNAASNVFDRLRCLIRWEFSSSPAYGARLVNIVLSNNDMEEKWLQELSAVRERLFSLRKNLHHLLTETYKTPGNWNTVLNGKGLFCFLPLTKIQCQQLTSVHHIHLVPNGRITISGLTEVNIDYVARCIDVVVRKS